MVKHGHFHCHTCSSNGFAQLMKMHFLSQISLLKDIGNFHCHLMVTHGHSSGQIMVKYGHFHMCSNLMKCIFHSKFHSRKVTHIGHFHCHMMVTHGHSSGQIMVKHFHCHTSAQRLDAQLMKMHFPVNFTPQPTMDIFIVISWSHMVIPLVKQWSNMVSFIV